MDHEQVVALLVHHKLRPARGPFRARHGVDPTARMVQAANVRREIGRRFVDPDSRQLALGEWRSTESQGKETQPGIAPHSSASSEERIGDDPVRFDESVPVEEIRLPHPPIDDEHEIVSEKTTLRLAQKPATYVVLKFIRPVIKRKADGVLSCPPAPASVLGKSVADVSFLACMVIDKFLYHLPLYRQHQRMSAAGIPWPVRR